MLTKMICTGVRSQQSGMDGFRRKREFIRTERQEEGVGVNTGWIVGLVWELKRVPNW